MKILKKVNLGEAISHIQRVLKNHIQQGGTAHLPVDADQNGFMTPDMLTLLKSANGNYESVETADFTTLPTGNWQTVGTPTNGLPTSDGFYNISVVGNDGRKLFIIHHSYTGRLWTYSVHTNGTQAQIPTGLRRIWQTKELFTGSVKDADVTIDFRDPIERYEYFEFFYGYLGTMYSQKVAKASVNSSFKLSALNLDAPATSRGISFGKIEFTKETATSIKSKLIEANYDPGTGKAPTSTNGDKIDVYRILGYF